MGENDRSLPEPRALRQLRPEPVDLLVGQVALLVEKVGRCISRVEADDLPPGEREAEIARRLVILERRAGEGDFEVALSSRVHLVIRVEYEGSERPRGPR